MGGNRLQRLVVDGAGKVAEEAVVGGDGRLRREEEQRRCVGGRDHRQSHRMGAPARAGCHAHQRQRSRRRDRTKCQPEEDPTARRQIAVLHTQRIERTEQTRAEQRQRERPHRRKPRPPDPLALPPLRATRDEPGHPEPDGEQAAERRELIAEELRQRHKLGRDDRKQRAPARQPETARRASQRLTPQPSPRAGCRTPNARRARCPRGPQRPMPAPPHRLPAPSNAAA